MRTFIATVTVHVYDEASEDVIYDRVKSCIDMHGDLSCGEVDIKEVDEQYET